MLYITMKQYLVEGATGGFPFLVDRSKPIVSESRPGGGTMSRIPGRFSVCDCINGNNRRYAKRVWEKNLTPNSILQESIKRNAAFGLLEHPKDGMVTLESPISHQVTKAELVESRDKDGKVIFEVVGEISLYNPTLVPESGKLLGLIEGGYNPLVSSRGYGSLKRAADGVDDVEEDYVCESWDVVIKPSFEQAQLVPMREPAVSSTTAKMAAPAMPESEQEKPQASLSESCKGVNMFGVYNAIATKNHGQSFLSLDDKVADSVVNQASKLTQEQLVALETEFNALKESKPSSGAVSSAAAASAPQTKNSMELNEIKSRIATLESMDPSKLQVSRFNESLTQIEELHQEVAQFTSADTKRSWDGQKLHKQLESIASRFTESAQAPVRQAKKLSEDNTKLMKVINAVAQTALTYKTKLGESVKASGTGSKLKEELVRRGQGWRKIAENRKAKLETVTKDWNDSCEALSIMSQRYHEDVTTLAKRLIVMEFKEKSAAPAIQKALKEATRLRHVAVIREMLEGKRAMPAISEEEAKKAAIGKPTDGEQPKLAKKTGKGEKGEQVAPEPGKVTNETKIATTATPLTEQQSEAKLLDNTRDPRSMNESVDLVKRLSLAAK